MKCKTLLQRIKDTFVQKFNKNEEKSTSLKHKGLSQVSAKHKKLAEQNNYSFLVDKKQEVTTSSVDNFKSVSHNKK